ncbi:MAG: DUF342 domain-containing protein [Syntrophomonadaceae bacterium]|nr:DUF342 domain-containing protein [Syntrophomonadaceae bacterium]
MSSGSKNKGQDQDGYVKVFVSDDAMEAYATVYGPKEQGQAVTLQVLLQALKDAKVSGGIQQKGLNEAIRNENWGKPVLVARGTLPKDGIDGRLEYETHSSDDEKGRPAEGEDGKVDFRNLNLVRNVAKGDLLVVRIPPVEGREGVSVLGKVIKPRSGKNLLLPKGKNTVSNEEQTHLYAAIDGHVAMVEGKLTVSPVLNVAGSVDFSTGNIDFVGDVNIRGSISSGFTVKAEGDIEVNGVIEGATVIARGNILIKNGITGGNKCLIKAGGSVFARFAENCRIEAGDDVKISEAILQSDVRANNSIRVEGRKAVIVGGVLQAGEEISARVIGSPLSSHTVLEVGMNPMLREEQKELNHIFAEKKKAFDSIAQYLQSYQKSGISPDRISDKKKVVLAGLLGDYKELNAELEKLQQRKLELEEELNRMQRGRIKIMDVIYPGVQISIGRSFLNVNDPIQYAMLTLKDGEVKIEPLRM